MTNVVGVRGCALTRRCSIYGNDKGIIINGVPTIECSDIHSNDTYNAEVISSTTVNALTSFDDLNMLTGDGTWPVRGVASTRTLNNGSTSSDGTRTVNGSGFTTLTGGAADYPVNDSRVS